MTAAELYRSTRALIGNPGVNDISNDRLLENILPSLQWLCAELEYGIVDDVDMLGLVAGQTEYQLPSDLAFILSIDWNNLILTPNSFYAWERDGTPWRTASATNPTGYAVQGRQLLLSTPPTAASITSDAFLRLRYITTSPGMNETGTPGLSDLDQELVTVKAAIRFCRTHPSELNAARLPGLEAELAEIWPAAKRRKQRILKGFHPRFSVHVTREPGARG